MTDRRKPAPRDAYRFPRRIAPGCTHQLGCKCDPPFWLRDPLPEEEARFFIPQRDPE